jgi:hypothetical protein
MLFCSFIKLERVIEQSKFQFEIYQVHLWHYLEAARIFFHSNRYWYNKVIIRKSNYTFPQNISFFINWLAQYTIDPTNELVDFRSSMHIFVWEIKNATEKRRIINS